MLKFLAISVMILVYHYAYNQQDNNWVFGDSIGIYFNAELELYNTAISANEACSTISDSLGNLLFYTNGQTVWNMNHLEMENGNDLIISGIIPGFTSSTTEGVLILPIPNSLNNFYIIHSYKDTMFYSIVDMHLNGGAGKVLAKNLVFYSTFYISEKMKAVKHANGRDWWLLLHEWPDVLAGDTNFIFDKFLITPEGVSEPIQQIIGSTYDADNFDPSIGQMKFNQEGNMLAFTSGKNVDLYDFDRCNGELSNWIQIPNVQGGGTYGCEFSPDGSKLYIGGYGSDLSTKVIQFCLDCEEEIKDTKKIIFENIYNDYGVGQFQIAPDNKIYVTLPYWGTPNEVYSEFNMHLCVINNPNEAGMACDFDTLTIDLGGHRTLLGLPNMPNYNLGVLVGSECDTIVGIDADLHQHDKFGIYPNPATDKLYFNTDLRTPVSITIYDVYGNYIKKIQNQILKEVDISYLNQGYYFIQIEEENLVLFRKSFIKIYQ